MSRNDDADKVPRLRFQDDSPAVNSPSTLVGMTMRMRSLEQRFQADNIVISDCSYALLIVGAWIEIPPPWSE